MVFLIFIFIRNCISVILRFAKPNKPVLRKIESEDDNVVFQIKQSEIARLFVSII